MSNIKKTLQASVMMSFKKSCLSFSVVGLNAYRRGQRSVMRYLSKISRLLRINTQRKNRGTVLVRIRRAYEILRTALNDSLEKRYVYILDLYINMSFLERHHAPANIPGIFNVLLSSMDVLCRDESNENVSIFASINIYIVHFMFIVPCSQ